MKSPASRDITIDTLRGLACVLLVSYHVIGDNPGSGLRIVDGPIRYTNDILALVRMPLFTVLSGLVYAMRPYQAGPGKFVGGKFRRLIIPMLVVGTAFAVVQSLTPGTSATVEHWYLLHLQPYAHYWFIESLFIVFLVLLPLEHHHLIRKRLGFTIVFAASIGLHLSGFGTRWFSIYGAIYLLPFFLCGLALGRFGLRKRIRPAVAAGTLLALCFVVLGVNPEKAPAQLTPVSLSVGLIACTALVALRWQQSLLARIGAYSYTIYLYHVFFTAATRIVLTKLGISGFPLLCSIGLLAGLIGPVLIEISVKRFLPFASIPLLGTKVRKA